MSRNEQEDEELKDVAKVVENLDSIMKGLNSTDENERRDAMARSELFLAEREKQKKIKEVAGEADGCRTATDRTVVNKKDESAELEAYRKAVEADAAERAARRRAREQNATKLKDEGNAAFKVNDYDLAVKKYSEGLDEMPWNTALYTNRAQGIKSYERAVRVAPLKQEKTIKGYIEKAEELRAAALKEKKVLDSHTRGDLESTTLLEMLEVLSRCELPKQHILEAARTLALSVGSDIQRTLFRAKNGFSTLLTNKYFEEGDPDVVQSVLDVIYAHRLLISYGNSLPGDQSSTIVHGCFTVLANVSVENAIRRNMATRRATWENSLRILEIYRSSASSLKTILVLRTVLGLLMNLALEKTDAMESVSRSLVSTTIHYISNRSDEVIERSCGLLSRLLSSYSDNLIPEVLRGTTVHQLAIISKSMLQSGEKEPSAAHAVRCLALLVQRNKEGRQVVMEAGGVHAMVDLLEMEDDSIVGNASLCIGSCAEEKRICTALADTNVVPRLLHHAKEAFGVVQQNCAVALAKLASGDDRHLEKLRALHGIEILHSRMK